jgi:Uncharacterized protein related to plant photosystem II stability/assembly factor
MACNKDEMSEPALQEIKVTPVKLDNNQVLTDASFANSKTGYVCGAMGTLIKTTDGGKTWANIKSEISPSLNCIEAVNEKNVYTARNELYSTINGGDTWQTAGLENQGSAISDIKFVDPKTGFIAKNGVMKTTDSGKTWTLKFDSGADEEYYAITYNKLQFIDSKTGFCVGGKTYDGSSVGNMVKTTDGGETWISMKMKMSQITAFYFLDANNGFVFNFKQELWKTTDGGTSWTKVSSSVPDKYTDCYFVNSSKIVLRTSKAIYHSIDGGLNWIKDFELTSTGGQLTRMKFIDSHHGYIVGNDGYLAQIELN